jgi:hypothetical protein
MGESASLHLFLYLIYRVPRRSKSGNLSPEINKIVTQEHQINAAPDREMATYEGFHGLIQKGIQRGNPIPNAALIHGWARAV